MTEMGSLEFSSLSAANSIRQRVRYSMGVSPTVSLNFMAKLDRDMPARSASACNVQRCAGSPFAYRRPSVLNPDASHARLVDSFTDWILQRVDELVALDQGPPLVVPLTVTFSLGSIRPDQVLREYERLYARLCDLLMNNHERPSKRHLLPFALAFRDDPSTRPAKHRDRPSAFAVFSNHPTVAPHVHSLVVVHPTLADRFLGIVGALEATWRRIPVRTCSFDAPTYVNRSLHADVPRALRIRELMPADLLGSRALVRAEIRRVLDYCAKLGRRRGVEDVDLFTVLPTVGLPRRR
jgi:hypothetical protein